MSNLKLFFSLYFVLLNSALADNCPTTGPGWQKLKQEVVPEVEVVDQSADLNSNLLLWDRANCFVRIQKDSSAPKALKACTTQLGTALNHRRGDDPLTQDAFPPKLTIGLLESGIKSKVMPKGPSVVEKILKAYPKAKHLNFDSAVVNPSAAHIFLIQLPGADHWVHFIEENNLAVFLGIKIETSAPEERKKLNVEFGMSVFSEDKHFPLLDKIENTNCFACHRTGAILPTVSKNSRHSKEVLEAMRIRIIQTSTIIGPKSTFASFGPMMGHPDLLKDSAALDRCIPLGVNRQRVTSSLNCAGCHDGAETGPISFPLGKSDIGRKLIENVILEGRMPPGPDKGGLNRLTAKERQAVLSCVVDTYYSGMKNSPGPAGTYVKYLMGETCDQTALAGMEIKPLPSKKPKVLPVGFSGHGMIRMHGIKAKP